jgi:hypothetical protein
MSYTTAEKKLGSTAQVRSLTPKLAPCARATGAQKTPGPLSAIRPGPRASLSAVCRKTLARDPAARLPTLPLFCRHEGCGGRQRPGRPLFRRAGG